MKNILSYAFSRQRDPLMQIIKCTQMVGTSCTVIWFKEVKQSHESDLNLILNRNIFSKRQLR